MAPNGCSDKTLVLIESITTHKEEATQLQNLVLYALIVIGAAMMADSALEFSWRDKAGLAVGFFLLAVLYCVRMVQCWLSVRYAANVLVTEQILTLEEIRGLRLSSGKVATYFVLALLMPLFVGVFMTVMILTS